MQILTEKEVFQNTFIAGSFLVCVNFQPKLNEIELN